MKGLNIPFLDLSREYLRTSSQHAYVALFAVELPHPIYLVALNAAEVGSRSVLQELRNIQHPFYVFYASSG